MVAFLVLISVHVWRQDSVRHAVNLFAILIQIAASVAGIRHVQILHHSFLNATFSRLVYGMSHANLHADAPLDLAVVILKQQARLPNRARAIL